MVEEHRPKTGIDAYSDPEELFNPIAMRKRKRQKKKFERFAADDSAPNSEAPSREASDAEEELKEEEASGDSDMTDGELEMVKELRRRNQKSGVTGKKYAKKSMICLECKKCFVDRKGLKKHMREVHRKEGWVFSSANVLSAFPVNTDSPADSGAEALFATCDEGLQSPVKKRGPKQGNTRCFACVKSFQHRLGYKNHIKVRLFERALFGHYSPLRCPLHPECFPSHHSPLYFPSTNNTCIFLNAGVHKRQITVSSLMQEGNLATFQFTTEKPLL